MPARSATTKDVANRLGVTPQAVYNWLRLDEPPPHTRDGKYYRFDLEEVERWYAQRKNGHSPLAKKARNQEIVRRVAAGERMGAVAEDYDISRQRVEQIVNADRQAARRATLDVDIPSGLPCERCGVEEAQEKHHPDYSDPERLQFLCRPCHHKADRERWEREARETMGLAYGTPLETLSEASDRVGLSTNTIAEFADTGVIDSCQVVTCRFLVPDQVDAAAKCHRSLVKVRREHSGSRFCPQGHLNAPWNRQGERGSSYCKACNSEHAQEAVGGRKSDGATQYDICLAFHETGAVGIDAHGGRIEATYRGGLTIVASRWSDDPWRLRASGEETFGRTESAGDARRLIRAFLASRLRNDTAIAAD